MLQLLVLTLVYILLLIIVYYTSFFSWYCWYHHLLQIQTAANTTTTTTTSWGSHRHGLFSHSRLQIHHVWLRRGSLLWLVLYPVLAQYNSSAITIYFSLLQSSEEANFLGYFEPESARGCVTRSLLIYWVKVIYMGNFNQKQYKNVPKATFTPLKFTRTSSFGNY